MYGHFYNLCLILSVNVPMCVTFFFGPSSTDLYFVACLAVVVSDFCSHILLNIMRALLELKDPFGSKGGYREIDRQVLICLHSSVNSCIASIQY